MEQYNGITAQMMYNDARQNGLAGFAPFYAWSWWATKSFDVILKDLNTTGGRYKILFNFMLLADIDNWSESGDSNAGSGNGLGGLSNGNANDGSNGSGLRIRNQWSAFSLVQTQGGCKLHYAHWKPLSSDYGDISVNSGDLQVNIKEGFTPLSTLITIRTLRKTLIGAHSGRQAARKIKSRMFSSLSSVEGHLDSDDGRRVYDQFATGGDNNDPDNY